MLDHVRKGDAIEAPQPFPQCFDAALLHRQSPRTGRCHGIGIGIDPHHLPANGPGEQKKLTIAAAKVEQPLPRFWPRDMAQLGPYQATDPRQGCGRSEQRPNEEAQSREGGKCRRA